MHKVLRQDDVVSMRNWQALVPGHIVVCVLT
jgi:hypothetical protein